MQDNVAKENAEKCDAFMKTLCEEYRKNNAIDPILYENNNVKRGLRNADGTGVLAGLTLIGDVVGYDMSTGVYTPVEGKLYYRGYDLEDLVSGYMAEDRYGFEEISYLLLFGKLPTKEQLADYTHLLSLLRFLPEYFTEDLILKSPSPNIMNKMARATLGLYSYDSDPDNLSLDNMMRQGMELIARFPMLLAYAYQAKRHFYDHDSLMIHFPMDNQSSAESILRALRDDKQFTKEEAQLLDLCMVIHAEHGGGNNSAFTTRVVASTGTDTYAAIAAALGSLKGPRHGGANIKSCEMMDDMMAHLKNPDNEGEVADYIVKILRKEANDHSGLVYGMGHAVYTLSDPRAKLIKKQARPLAEKKGFGEEFKLLEMIERLTPDLFAKEKGSTKRICANVDLYSGIVFRMLGFPVDLYTPIFAASRIAGWIAHRIEEMTTNARIIRPAYQTVSPLKPYIRMNERN